MRVCLYVCVVRLWVLFLMLGCAVQRNLIGHVAVDAPAAPRIGPERLPPSCISDLGTAPLLGGALLVAALDPDEWRPFTLFEKHNLTADSLWLRFATPGGMPVVCDPSAFARCERRHVTRE